MKEKKIQYDNLCILIKFGSKENLEKLQNGQLYMKNLLYFINLERENSSPNGGQGDADEGQLILENAIVRLSNPDTGEFLCQRIVNHLASDFGYQKYPVFCMFSLDSRNHVEESIEDGKLVESFRFSSEQIEKISKDFGEYALVFVNIDEFFRRVDSTLKKVEISEYEKDFVRYCGPNDVQHFRDVFMNRSRVAFWKREKYAYQQEFRLIIPKDVDDHLVIDIGEIKDISKLVETKVLLNSQVDIVFNT